MFSREKNFYGGHGIVGAQVPIGTGLAFSHKYKGDGGLCATYLGDGAANQGQVCESMNMASLWKLPVLFIVENNQYAMGTSQARGCAGELYRRGEGFNIPGKVVDGMSLLAVREAAAEAVQHIRSGKGPMLLEVKTYRYRGHSMSDPAKYRTKEEVEKFKTEKDPLEQMKGVIVAGGYAGEEDFKALERDIKAIVQDAADFSLQSPEPDASELWTDVLK
jgi:pyruvate dehydrogenase E1 component alpha subunit